MRVFFILLVFVMLGSRAMSQDVTPFNSIDHSSASPKHLILYDPVFWKEQLKLSSLQQKRIDKINLEFYENIKTVFSIYSGKHSSYQVEISSLLMNRSEQIWETFHGKQKRKWEKLDAVNSLPDESSRTQNSL